MWRVSLLNVTFFLFLCFAAERPDLDLRRNTFDDGVNPLSNTELIMAFVIIRHGDRTPDLDEISLFPQDKIDPTFYPYGPKALTNVGKVRSFKVGQLLRLRYDGWLSKLYQSDEMKMRTTDFDRTKMTALTMASALYPPVGLQRWNRNLEWQPVPYDVKPFEDDDLLYFYNCPEYTVERDIVYGLPDAKDLLQPYVAVFQELRERTGKNITTARDAFYLDNLFQATENIGVQTPDWAERLMPELRQLTILEFIFEFYNSKLIRLSTGVLLDDIFKMSLAAMQGSTVAAKLQIYSAHENNVVALMAASGVFQPHQPPYGATFMLELRREVLNGRYAFSAAYAPEAGIGNPAQLVKIGGCSGGYLCEFNEFRNLTADFVLPRSQFKKECNRS